MHSRLCDYLSELVYNSLESDSTIVKASIIEDKKLIKLCVWDNGRGMCQRKIKNIFNPFLNESKKHPRRTMGFGLPFLKQFVDSINGKIKVESKRGLGTKIEIEVDRLQIDCPPIGDLPTTIVGILSSSNYSDFEFSHQKDRTFYTISKSELLERYGRLDKALNISKIRDDIRQNELKLGN